MPGSVIKIIAALAMLVDHAGLILFPDQLWMRIVGRIAFPLFAYCIAEGYRYTRHRLRYFLQIFLLGVGCQIVYYIAERDWYLGILLTFSLSIALMEPARRWKTAVRMEDTKAAWLWGIAFFAAVLTVWGLTTTVTVDYGFVGVLLPLLAYLPEETGVRKGVFIAGILALAVDQYLPGGYVGQFFGLLAVPFLCAYNGKPGSHRMKWFFYIFYPAHLAVLYGIAALRTVLF